ncbi:MAG: hypothetical protein HC906_17235 [Bacteroidales bacterium]|nr:hypothetical protein [Bacteroidales bacterium]
MKGISVDIGAEPFLSFLQNQYKFISHQDIMFLDDLHYSIIKENSVIYGLELSARKTTGRAMGMISYTWSKINKHGEENRNYNPYYDRRNNIALSGSYELSKRITLSSSWIFMTGNPYNQPFSKYEIRGRTIPLYADELYNKRMPSYHRLDIGFRIKFGKWTKFKHSLGLSVYNAYARKNPLFYNYYDKSGAEPNFNGENKSFYMTEFHAFQFFPSFSYEFAF